MQAIERSAKQRHRLQAIGHRPLLCHIDAEGRVCDYKLGDERSLPYAVLSRTITPRPNELADKKPNVLTRRGGRVAWINAQQHPPTTTTPRDLSHPRQLVRRLSRRRELTYPFEKVAQIVEGGFLQRVGAEMHDLVSGLSHSIQALDEDLAINGPSHASPGCRTLQKTLHLAESQRLSSVDSAGLPDKVKNRARKRLKQLHKPRKGGRRALPLEHWEDVASAYTTAHLERKSPTKAVAEEFNISYSAAAKKVAKCRQLGLLPPTTRGKAKA